MIDEEKSKLTSGKFDTSLVEIIESPSSDEGRVVELPSISRKSTNSERQMAFEQALVILSERSEGLSNNDAVKCLDFFDVLYCKEDGTDNGFRHQYASIFDVMSGSYNAEKNDPDFAPTETMDHLSESIGFIQQSMPQSLSPDFQKKFGKLVDHINLEYKKLNYIIRQNRLQQESIEGSDKQFNNTIRLQQQRMELLSKRIYEKENQIDRMQREYIAILGIFAAVVIAMNGSIVFTSSSINAIAGQNILYLAFIISIVGAFLFNVLFSLFTFVYRMVRQNGTTWGILSKETFTKINRWIIGMIVVLSFTSCLFGCLENDSFLSHLFSAIEDAIAFDASASDSIAETPIDSTDDELGSAVSDSSNQQQLSYDAVAG